MLSNLYTPHRGPSPDSGALGQALNQLTPAPVLVAMNTHATRDADGRPNKDQLARSQQQSADGQQATAHSPTATGHDVGQQAICHTSGVTNWNPNKGVPKGLSTGDTPQPPKEDICPPPDFLQRIQYPTPSGQSTPDGRVFTPKDDFDDITPAGSPPSTSGPAAPRYASWPFPARTLPQKQAWIYEQSKMAAIKSDPSLRPPLQTQLNLQEWRARATGHEDDHWILDAVEHGFPIQYAGPPKYDPPLLYNHSSALNYRKVIQEYITKEKSHGAIYGPFTSPPFTPWMVFSPIMTREKPDSQERRVIVDLSYPDGGINQHIEPHWFNGRPAVHNLPTIEHAVAAISHTCPGDVHLAVVDLSRAYRQFPVPPTDWPLLGIQFDGSFYFDARLPFGARLSSYAMQSVARFIVRAMERSGATAFMYLDDILLVAGSAPQAERHYTGTLHLLSSLGLQVATHKLQRPARCVTWLGIEIDMNSNSLSIPTSKLQEIQKCLAAAARQSRITLRHMQSILGYINHLAKVVRAARVFIARLLAALRAATSDVIIVTPPVKADLAWFSRYMSKYNARAIIPHARTVLRIWADSSLSGAGATDGARFYSYVYPDSIANYHHITQLEAVNVLAAVRAFVSDAHAAGSVQVFCDNMASVSSYSSGRARDTVLAACCRAMWFHAAATQTTLEFTHMPGESMVLPDALSRAHTNPTYRNKASQLVAQMHLTEVKVQRAHFNYASFT